MCVPSLNAQFHSVVKASQIASTRDTPQRLPCDICTLSDLLPVYIDVEALPRVACGQPALGVLVVEGPRRDDHEEGERGAGEPGIQGQADVLCEVADQESNDLESLVSHRAGGRYTYTSCT
jgi:hypothetical protein